MKLDPRSWTIDPRKWTLDPRKWKLTGWRQTAAYVAFFAFAFVLALRLTFPVEAVKERLILDASAEGYQVKVKTSRRPAWSASGRERSR